MVLKKAFEPDAQYQWLYFIVLWSFCQVFCIIINTVYNKKFLQKTPWGWQISTPGEFL